MFYWKHYEKKKIPISYFSIVPIDILRTCIAKISIYFCYWESKVLSKWAKNMTYLIFFCIEKRVFGEKIYFYQYVCRFCILRQFFAQTQYILLYSTIMWHHKIIWYKFIWYLLFFAFENVVNQTFFWWFFFVKFSNIFCA